jgi:hypothetical protein
MKEFLGTALLEPLATVGTRIVQFLPNLVAAFFILAVGWALAWGLGRGVERTLRLLSVDRLADRIGLNAALTRGGLKPDPCHLAGRMVYWGLLALTTIAALGALDLAPINQLAIQFLGYIPHLMTAVVILTGGIFLSNFVARATLIAAVNAGFRPATTAAGLARWGVLLVALAMALEQLGIAQHIVVVGFGIAFGGVVLSLALAFGLGSTHLAREYLERQFGKDGGHHKDDLTHL